MSGGGDMSGKDPAIKLFGRKIQIPATSSQIPSNSAPKDACNSLKKPEAERPCAENSEQVENSSHLGLGDNKKEPEESQHSVQKNVAKENPKPVEDKKTSSTEEDKIMKKPDKIQQCPRCNSMDTKFCYFNNYNVNQPRHFCKNCQRYWTAGGTMRNVPVGAGRRRNKQHLSSQYNRHIIVSPEGIPIPPTPTTLDSSAAFRSSPDGNSTLLKFGPESADSILNLGDHQKRSFDLSSMNCAENGEEASLCGSSVTNTSSAQGNELSNELNTSSGVQCYPVPSWVFPVQWYPLQFVAPPYWTGAVSIGSSNGCLSPSSSTSNSCCSGNASPTLGKHSRDAVLTDEEKSAKCVLVPKTLRI